MVHLQTLLGSAAALVLSATASPLRFHEGAKALYFQTNESPNKIAAVAVHQNGKLGNYTFHLTGGNGGAEVTDMGPSAPDALGSQHSVVVHGDYLFTVNAGSNDISLFRIPCENPTNLKLINTAPVNGGFPNTIAVKDGRVCVGYAGSPAGVSCAEWGPLGVGEFDTNRQFDLHQSNPPNASLILVSDVVFAEDGSRLLVTTRGSAETPGFVATYDVDWTGEVSQKGKISGVDGFNASFGVVPIPNTQLAFVAEPELGGYILDVASPSKPIAGVTVPGQQAICWSALTHKSVTGILPDAKTNTITQVELPCGRVIQQWTSTNGNSGQLDFDIDATDKFFALAFSAEGPEARIASIDLSGSNFTDIDNIVISGTTMSSQGLALYH